MEVAVQMATAGEVGPPRAEGTSIRPLDEVKEVGLRCDDLSCMYGSEDNDEDDAPTTPALPWHPRRRPLRGYPSTRDSWPPSGGARKRRQAVYLCGRVRACMYSMLSAWSSAHAAMTLVSGCARTSGRTPTLVAPLRMQISRLRFPALPSLSHTGRAHAE